MIVQTVIVALAAAVPVGDFNPVACDLVDQASAEAILGANPMKLSDATTPDICMYMKADGQATLMVQIFGQEMFDAVPIHPRTPVDIGDQGRFNEDPSGTAIVQFRKGDYSVRVSVEARSVPSSPYLPSLLDASRLAASRLDSARDPVLRH